MPEDVVPEPREGAKLKARIDELEKIVRLLVKATAALEDISEEYTLPKGTYLGVTID